MDLFKKRGSSPFSENYESDKEEEIYTDDEVVEYNEIGDNESEEVKDNTITIVNEINGEKVKTV